MVFVPFNYSITLNTNTLITLKGTINKVYALVCVIYRALVWHKIASRPSRQNRPGTLRPRCVQGNWEKTSLMTARSSMTVALRTCRPMDVFKSMYEPGRMVMLCGEHVRPEHVAPSSVNKDALQVHVTSVKDA